MGNKFAEIAFTPGVRAVQQAMGSSKHYDRVREAGSSNDSLGAEEAEFISQRDSFYMASVSESGWPYVQHRGGPAGFLKLLDAQTLGFADFRGNRQYVSVGNLQHDDRVSLFLMDYPNRTRLKILGHARIVSLDEPASLARLEMPGYKARVERGFLISVAAFDWNCPQHITPRFTATEIESITQPLNARLAELERQLQECRAAQTRGP